MTTERDVATTQCLPPHKVTHEDKMYAIAHHMSTHGWKGESLIGYRREDGMIQLLSGSHRWAAARLVLKRVIPVRVYPEWYVRALWGTDAWLALMGRAS